MNLKQKLLAKLLHLANSNPPHPSDDFYHLKKKLLQKYGTCQGGLIQQINKECYGYYNPNWGDYGGCIGTDCLKCDGSGVFETRYYRLIKWDWCGYSFLIPDDWKFVAPEEKLYPDIVGHVEHKVTNYRLAREAHFWLYLLAGEWDLFRCEMHNGFHVRCGLWPMMNLQRACGKLSMWRRDIREYFGKSTCYECGKVYRRKGGHSAYCKDCLKDHAVDPPF